eukprot:TRINITY_DN16337_c1_g1_i3.p1 TRINITY_DN16337_c1_g1~~TRINITY_DN16337_c1_g1_i3.p1  ORF type:complete len:719 (-),score=64.31 TRINITY_DN16337_c1_g1_i3:125-2281(-)
MSQTVRFERRMLALEQKMNAGLEELREELMQQITTLQRQVKLSNANAGTCTNRPSGAELAAALNSHDQREGERDAADAFDRVLPGQPEYQKETVVDQPQHLNASPTYASLPSECSQQPEEADRPSRRISAITHLPTDAKTFDFDHEGDLIPFQDSTWSVVMISGDLFSTEYMLGIAMVVLTVVIQGYFVYMCSTEAFQGGKLELRLTAAKTWRLDAGHNYQFADTFSTSLASRVCGGDGSLTASADHRDLLIDINYYLGMTTDRTQANFLQPSAFSPGVALCMLSILMWGCTCFSELRGVFDLLQAVLQIPRGERTMYRGSTIACISASRLAFCLLGVFVRTAVVVSFFVSGSAWLAHTLEVEDLVLNAVALEAIFHVDKLLFAAAIPSRLQRKVQSLEPVKVPMRRWRNHVELGVLLVFFTVLAPLTWATLIRPTYDNLLEVKQLYCSGTLNFVWEYHPGIAIVGVATSNPYPLTRRKVDNGTLHNEAELREESVKARIGNDSSLTFELGGVKHMLEWSTATMAQIASGYTYTHAEACVDTDHDPAQFGHEVGFSVLRYRLGVDTCPDMRFLCKSPEFHLLRLLCPVTCGCDLSSADPFYRTPAYGCPSACKGRNQRECTDTVPQASWLTFWDDWLKYNVETRRIQNNSRYYGDIAKIANTFKNAGCPYLLEKPRDPVSNDLFCNGSSFFAPLAGICPVSCGCANFSYSFCPRTCLQ